MPISSSVVVDFPGRGYENHKGKGVGHQKRLQEEMADGHYTIRVTGVDHDNPTAVSQTSAPTTLEDGSIVFTEVRQGDIETGPTGLRLETDNNNGRLRYNTGLDADNQMTLGDLDALNFDYIIHSFSRTDVVPVIRLIIDADGNLATTTDRGELVFEWAYQGFGPTTSGSLQHADLVGDDWVAWQRANGQNFDQIANMTTFSDWSDADGHTVAGGLTFNEDSLVLGWSIALGSGNGTGSMSIDNVQVGGVTTDFYG